MLETTRRVFPCNDVQDVFVDLMGRWGGFSSFASSMGGSPPLAAQKSATAAVNMAYPQLRARGEGMKRSVDSLRLLLIALVAVIGAGCGSAPVRRHRLAHLPSALVRPPGTGYVSIPDLQSSSNFAVTFAGIICITEDEYDEDSAPAAPPTSGLLPRRTAMVLQGNPMSKHHEALLGIETHSLDKESRRELMMSLRDLSGQTVHCDSVYCWARIRGIGIRIVGDHDADPECQVACDANYTVKEDASFQDLVPKLGNLALGSNYLRDDICEDYFPREPVDGCVRVSGGELLAYPFKSFKQGRFVNPNGSKQPPMQFADVVMWHGNTTGPARVQIKSHATLDRFETVKMKNTNQPLRVAIVNLGHAHHTSTHFP